MGDLDNGENYILVLNSSLNDGNHYYKKIEFVPILNKVLTVYYKQGENIPKANIASQVYYRDTLGYVSLINTDLNLNTSLHYFIEKTVYESDVKLENGERIVKDEKRRYRLYLDFVESPPEYDHNYDQKIYNNNIFPTTIKLSNFVRSLNPETGLTEPSHTFNVQFSANNSRNDMYTISLNDDSLVKSINSQGYVAVHYDSLIQQILRNMEMLYGVKLYDSEIYIGRIWYTEATYSFNIKPSSSVLQKIILAADGSTIGADAVLTDLTVYINRNSLNLGQDLSDAINLRYREGQAPADS